MPTDFLGQYQSTIIKKHRDGVAFAHWLYLPSLGLLLSFDKQICCQVDNLS